MRTLEDVLEKLAEWDIEPGEVRIALQAYNYLLRQAKEVLVAEEDDGEEWATKR